MRELNTWGWDFIECTLPYEVPGGTQESSIKSSIGDATKAQDSLGYTWAGDKYDIKIVPQIDGLSVNAGSIQGQRIVISGTGFSKFPSEVEVRVGGVPCQVLRSTITEIECEVDAQQTPVPLNTPVIDRKQNKIPFCNQKFIIKFF